MVPNWKVRIRNTELQYYRTRLENVVEFFVVTFVIRVQ
jgi:hypothetical protein